jgi:hypothetical protein
MSESIKEKILSPLWYAYFVGAMIAFPYFNYKYAKENGFMNWLMLGEIVPSMKAMAWPAFAYHEFTTDRPPKLTDAEKKELLYQRAEFSASVDFFTNALRMDNESYTKPPTREDALLMIGLFR